MNLQMSGEGAVQAEGTARAKARAGRVIPGAARRPVWLEQREKKGEQRRCFNEAEGSVDQMYKG